MITPPQLEVADIFRAHWKTYLENHSATSFQHKVAGDIMSCRTEALGGHAYRCLECAHIEQSYNSCRNRHCPKCQGKEILQWVEERKADLLPVPYFHTVFTLPNHFNALVLQNKRLIYNLLFQAVNKTLLKIGKNNYQCKIGFFAVLHTWGQLLQFHPHIHCVIPACGIKPNGEVITFSDRYLFPDKVLSAVFRGKLIEALKQSHKQNKLEFHRELSTLKDPGEFEHYLTKSVQSDWVVHSQPPFAGPETVVKYLARYTHRVAISNSRLIQVDENQRVLFRYRDYKDNSKQKITSLSAHDFISRFLLHLVPRRFVRIRHYGFLSRSNKFQALAKIRAALLCGTLVTPEPQPQPQPALNPHSRAKPCPCCGADAWRYLGKIKPTRHFKPLAQAPPDFLTTVSLLNSF